MCLRAAIYNSYSNVSVKRFSFDFHLAHFTVHSDSLFCLLLLKKPLPHLNRVGDEGCFCTPLSWLHIHHCYKKWLLHWGTGSDHLTALIIICPGGMRLQKMYVRSKGGASRDLFSCQQRSKIWLNKRFIHALVDSLGSLILSLKWTLPLASTTCVLVKKTGRASFLSILD